MGVGKYRSKISGKQTKQYITWKGMIKRCYSAKSQEVHHTYIGCTVCDEWLNFQVFAKWFDDNYISGFHLDKDIKVKGNKVYGPNVCRFVSRLQNNIEAHARRYTVINPEGDNVYIYNMSKFCKENGLDQGSMSAVCSGKLSNHKGWSNNNLTAQ